MCVFNELNQICGSRSDTRFGISSSATVHRERKMAVFWLLRHVCKKFFDHHAENPFLNASKPMGTGGPFPGVKRGRGLTLTTHPPSSAMVKNEYELYCVSLEAPIWHVTGWLYLHLLNTKGNKRYNLDDGLLGCSAVEYCHFISTFRRNYVHLRG